VLALCASMGWAAPMALFVANYDSGTPADFAAGSAADVSDGVATITTSGAKYGSGAYYGSYVQSRYNTMDNISATAGTVMFWYKSDVRDWTSVFNIGTSDFWAPTSDFAMRASGWNGMWAYVSDSSGRQYSVGGPNVVGDVGMLNHYAVTWDTDAANGTIDLAMYVNGVLVDSLNDVAWSGFAFDSTMQVGGYYHPDWGRWVTPNAYGTIDDFGIANHAMSQTQIAAIVNSGVALTAGAMVPEPMTLALLAVGGVMGWRRRMM